MTKRESNLAIGIATPQLWRKDGVRHMTTYLTIITTTLVVTQIMFIQNAKQLKRQHEAIEGS